MHSVIYKGKELTTIPDYVWYDSRMTGYMQCSEQTHFSEDELCLTSSLHSEPDCWAWCGSSDALHWNECVQPASESLMPKVQKRLCYKIKALYIKHNCHFFLYTCSAMPCLQFHFQRTTVCSSYKIRQSDNFTWPYHWIAFVNVNRLGKDSLQ